MKHIKEVSTWPEWIKWYEHLKQQEGPVVISDELELRRCTRGWGTFARKEFVVHADQRLAPMDLFGLVTPLTDEIKEDMTRIGFDSTMTVNDIKYVLYGPLSLTNHQCGYPLRFKQPRSHAFLRMHAGNFGRRMTFRPGQEVLVRYCHAKTLWFPCSCAKCLTKPPKKKQKRKSLKSKSTSANKKQRTETVLQSRQ